MATIYATYILQCLTSVHAGDGSSTGSIDSPIQREKTTSLPVIRASTLRGGIRECFEKPIYTFTKKPNNSNNLTPEHDNFISTFGYKDSGDVASALDVYPARLLFFPIRSLKGVFTYATCPFVLNRFLNDMKLFDNEISGQDKIENLENGKTSASSNLLINNKHLGLEEFLFEQIETPFDISTILNKITSIDRLKNNYAVIDDTSFAYLTRLFTEKVTRNKIEISTGVAADTGLFNEEYLPEESILYTTFGFTNEFKEKGLKDTDIESYFVNGFKSKPIFQLGGNKSIGKGIIKHYKI